MEVISRSESSGFVATAALEFDLKAVLESMALETLLGAGKSLLWLLCVVGSSQCRTDIVGEGCGIIKGFPLSSLGRIMSEPTMPECKDDGESDEEEDDEDEVGGDEDDGGEEEYSGDEGNEEDDEDELEANGGGSDDEDEDEDDEEDDEDGDDEDDDEDGEEEEDDEDQPPSKKRK